MFYESHKDLLFFLLFSERFVAFPTSVSFLKLLINPSPITPSKNKASSGINVKAGCAEEAERTRHAPVLRERFLGPGGERNGLGPKENPLLVLAR